MKKSISLLLAFILLISIFATTPLSTSALSATYGNFQCTVENGSCIITKYVGTDTVVEVPKTVNGFKVVELGTCVFQFSDVTKVTLPNTIKRIGGSAFDDCKNLKSITIPKSVEVIGNWCFSDCENLETVTLNEGLKKIEGNVFEDCYALKSVRLPDSLEEASYNLFKNCKSLKSVYIGANCGNIEGNCKYPGARYGAFGDAYNVEKITISSKNKYYSSQDGVWYDKNKTMIMYYPPAKKDSEYTVPLSVTTIPFRGIYGASYLKKIRISSNVTSINQTHAFGYGPRNGSSYNSDPYKDLVVAGYSGTKAHEYAFNNGFTFEQLDKPNSVKLNKTKHTINGTPSYQLKATVTPSTALTDLTWSSSNTKVAKVNGYGKVTAKSSGTAKITVKTFNGKKATCVVTVKAPKKVKLNKTTKTLSRKKTVTLTAKLSGGKDNALKWSTSNKKVAKITKVSNTKYKVTALKKGTANITVKTYNGKKSVCTIKVR